MTLRVAALCLILSISFTANAAVLQPNAQWFGDPSFPDGTAWTYEIVSSSPTGTKILLECPGFWVQPVMQNGQTRSQIVLPGTGSLTTYGYPELPSITKILAIPDDREPDVIITDVVFEAFPLPDPYIYEPESGSSSYTSSLMSGVYPEDWAVSHEPAIFKDYRVSQLDLFPIRYDADQSQVLLATRLEVEVQTSQLSTTNIKTFHTRHSEAFTPLYEAIIDNFDEFNTASPLVGEGPRGAYLIILDDRTIPDLDQVMEQFAVTKGQLGYDVSVVGLTEIGETKPEIGTFILEKYYGGDVPLDYVLLIGDISGSIKIPAHSKVKPGGSGEQDVTDHPYALLEGTDYFPDIMIGRFSVSSDFELATVISKNRFYSMTPTLGGSDWITEACVVAGNFSDTGIAPITPVWTSLWLVDKLYDYGYTQVDTIFYWEPDPTYPGTAQIAESINEGVGLVAYRGWADANGWQYPVFKVDDIYALTNGYYLPVVVSMVCNTGDFGNLTYDPCFGEAWLRAGSPFSPKAGVGFFGPSDLHTNTKWNNALYAGFWEGLLEENLYRFGQAGLRAKLELYYGFPEDTDINGYADFYFHVYNILGDPELPIWTKAPEEINVSIPDEVLPGQQIVTATVTDNSGSPKGGAYVAFYKEGEVLSGAVTGSDGVVEVQINPLTAGTLTVTATKQNCLPNQQTLSVSLNEFPLGMTASTIGDDGVLSAGESADLTVTIKNFGTAELTDVTGELSEQDGFTTITQSTVNAGAIAGEASVDLTFPVDVLPTCPQGHLIEFTLTLADNQAHSNQLKFWIPVGGMLFMPAGAYVESGSLEPGSSAEIRLMIHNAGTLSATQLSGTLTTTNPHLSITSDLSAYPAMLPGSVGTCTAAYEISVDAGALVGSQAIFELEISANDGYTQTISYPLQLGEASTTAPLGPDSYGYFAYDDTDTDYPEAPMFDWIELDPNYGGSYDVLHNLADDESVVIPLPFSFTYYGAEYDTITVCSNGWLAFDDTWMANFRNWNLPSALGPPALVAPFWDDLKADTTGGHNAIHVYTRYDAGEGRYIIEWSRTINRFGYEVYNNWKEETFEVVLFDPAVHTTTTGNGEMLFQYLEVNNIDANNNFATVGIEDYGHRRGLQYTYANDYPSTAAPLENNRAIKITTDAPNQGSSASSGPLASNLRFDAARPNPANPTTVLNFEIPRDGIVNLNVYNTMGQRIMTVIDGVLSAGAHQIEIGGEGIASGIYFATLHFENQTITQKILFLK
ncbi:T9SS type A sorting domain-containing protein [bacterium]|nr:T9SS type A sorting domain-containing protein [bacterium]